MGEERRKVRSSSECFAYILYQSLKGAHKNVSACQRGRVCFTCVLIALILENGMAFGCFLPLTNRFNIGH